MEANWNEDLYDVLSHRLPRLIQSSVDIPGTDFLVRGIEMLDEGKTIKVRFVIVGFEFDEYVWFFKVGE